MIETKIYCWCGTTVMVMIEFYYFYLETLKQKPYAAFAIIRIHGKMETGKGITRDSWF